MAKQSKPLRVIAHLDGPIAGEPPHLDSLLIYRLARLMGKDAEPGEKMDRSLPCPDTSLWQIGLRRDVIRPGLAIACCSSPIFQAVSDSHEHVVKRLGVEHSSLVAPEERRNVQMTGGYLKAYRLPLRVRRLHLNRVIWLAFGVRGHMLDILKEVPAIGKKISLGFGRVASWEITDYDGPTHRNWPLWCESEAGPVLMRPVPKSLPGLPCNLAGCKPGFGAWTDPYWHPSRYEEILEPC